MKPEHAARLKEITVDVKTVVLKKAPTVAAGAAQAGGRSEAGSDEVFRQDRGRWPVDPLHGED
jgi:hypothetical protein